MGVVDVTPLRDVSAGAWLAEHLTSLGGRVRDVVPAAYEAYVLVTHHGDEDGGPPIGCLDRRSLAALRDVLVTRTTTPDVCWFALWEGHPGLPLRWATLPKLHLPERAYLLFRAAVDQVVELAVETEVLAYFGDVQGMHLVAVDEAGGRVPSTLATWPGTPRQAARRDGCAHRTCGGRTTTHGSSVPTSTGTTPLSPARTRSSTPSWPPRSQRDTGRC